MPLTRTNSINEPQNVLAKNLSLIHGIGEKTQAVLEKNHILTVFDLLLHVPKSIVNQTESVGFLYMEKGRTYVVKSKVFAVKISGIGKGRRLEAVLQDHTGKMSVIFFGPAVSFAQNILKPDKTVQLVGEAKEFLGRIQMVHPRFVDDNKCDPLKPQLATYSQLGGLAPAVFRRLVEKTLLVLKQQGQTEHVKDDFLQKNRLSSLKDALLNIHEPKDQQTVNWDERGSHPDFRRLAFEELLSFYVRLEQERQPQKQQAVAIIPCDLDILAKDFLPFSLTKAQRRACEEILADLSQPFSMTRLLQGDVGSGKTAVSAIASLQAVNAGLQIAILAPTEVLAEQLFLVYQNFFAKKSVGIALFTAHVKGKDRQLLLKKIASAEINIVVGTHALLCENILWKNLGLVIIDEQHRFGVKQRAELLARSKSRSGHLPHLLVMSATPIPRTLALTCYGDLDLSVIDERPKGRMPIHTQILTGPVLEVVLKLCERILLTKQKAFIVFPLVEESEHLDLENAKKAASLIGERFGSHTVMLLHGKMKSDEKTAALKAFLNHHISFLVATTVVEVGIDIPDATCMVIVHPERFGLAQLHQLRGRVGRKDLKSFCFLVTDITNKFGTAYQRLLAMCTTDNGFKLAEIDLKLRGPGELLGTKQSGLPNFLIFNHNDFADLVEPAKSYSKFLASKGIDNTHLHLHAHHSAHFS